jgi:hypothetical protein
MKVVLKLDVYFHPQGGERYWERQVWIGSYPDKPSPAECDPLVLLKEYEHGAEHILFRLDEYKAEENASVYRPCVLHNSDSFIKNLPNWGFRLEPVVNREPVR